MEDETVTFDDVVCLAQTGAAILVLVENEEVWIPLSQVGEDSEVREKDDTGDLVITKWIAKKKGLL